ncbi:MAG: chromosomal replication initiator protein DnaA [Oceanicaulis sp.]|uniref:chromosomal replication initiator protein DnaA n=1 Tax=Oceanicaulis sp. UBA2681 TaxID=1947007 RepID=UPI000C09293C|nr:chromosomal replication initiator protein DnaA [Oceanicaulis sp. UBA2681]MAP49551.1 chromosomal replication initiator protein DnaA [Oceanicaulis sp.]HCR66306.1 chromosomal replication initiator protein DnaA [Oceanicaulis sp.]|tara:strand:- start:1591 stop:3033 length:1443 start_codon:yes stop_codon:yes gene_type:complete
MGYSQDATARRDGAAMMDSSSIVAVWRAVRARLREECGDLVYAAEIARLRVELDAAGRVCVICPNEFGRSWVEDNVGMRLRALWATVAEEACDILICTEKTLATQKSHTVSVAALSAGGMSETAALPLVEDTVEDSDAKREARFTFDTFMVGSANMMAATAARAVASADAPPFNPVFFHGDYGVGKSHLLAAIAHAASLSGKRKKVLYLTAEEFLNGFQSALRARDVQPFKDLVRDCDMLLIDDVHFICGKPRTEDEFLQTVTSLISAEKQVVLASHCAPSQLSVSDDRLRNVMAGGFNCPLQGPDLDLRRKILDCKIAQARNHCPDLEVPETVRDFLAARVTSSARELEGVLNNIIVRTAYMNRPVTMETVEEALGELPVKAERRITVDDIQKMTASYFSITVDDLISKRRTKAVVRPRHIAMYLAKTMTTRSLPDIGRRFGGRDHSTVIHAVNKITETLTSDAVLAEDVEALRRRLRG